MAGESAGSLAAPLYGALVSDRLPDAKITVLADGSGSYPDVSRINEIIAGWGFGTTARPWPSTAQQWSVPGLFIQSGRHDPAIVFARHDYADDERQRSWYPIAGVPATDLLSLIDANEAQIEDAGVNLLSYVVAGRRPHHPQRRVLLHRGGRSRHATTTSGPLVVCWLQHPAAL